MPPLKPFLLLALVLSTACVRSKSDDDDDDGDGDGDGGNGGGWDLGTDSGLDGGTADGGTADGGTGDGGTGDGGTGDGGTGDGGSGDGGTGDGGSGDGGGGGDGGFGDGGAGDGGGGDGGGAALDLCNPYWPLEIEGDTERVYATLDSGGTEHEEITTISGWNSTRGTADIVRTLDSDTSKAPMLIEEDWACVRGEVTQLGYRVSTGAYGEPVVFSEPVVRLAPIDSLDPGDDWTVSYTSSVGGEVVWETDAEYVVAGFDTIEVEAGIFEVLQLEAIYERTSYSGYVASVSGVVRYYLAPGLGLVYSADYDSSDTLREERELISYGDFAPFDPAEL